MYRRKSPEDTSKARLLTALLLLVIFVSTGAILLFNKSGFMAITEIQAEVENVKQTNMNLEYRIDSLTSIINLLENDSLYMEKRVREILGWGRQNETIIKLVPPRE